MAVVAQVKRRRLEVEKARKEEDKARRGEGVQAALDAPAPQPACAQSAPQGDESGPISAKVNDNATQVLSLRPSETPGPGKEHLSRLEGEAKDTSTPAKASVAEELEEAGPGPLFDLPLELQVG